MRAFACLACLGIVGCGPSFHAVYEGNARFEHCYALEEDPHSPMREKADCWRDWSERYTYGQTRDRIQYATARYVGLAQAANAPTDEALMMAAPGMTPRVSTISAPAPTSPYAPPPKVLEDGGAAPPQDHAAPPPPSPAPSPAPEHPAPAPPVPAPPPAQGPAARSLPASPCTDHCAAAFRGCDEKPTAGPEDRERCERVYRTCMLGCFK